MFKKIETKKEEKVFLKEALNLTGCEISINNLKENSKAPFFHKHKENEEIYIIISGAAKLIVDNETLEVKEGDCVKVSPEAKRAIETDKSPVSFICVQAKENSLSKWALNDAELC